MVEVGIIGAGPAGLSAALLLGRCGRAVVVFDSGKPRNGASRALHGFLTRDGTPPLALRQLARNELERYPSLSIRQDVAVQDVHRHARHFELVTADGERIAVHLLLLATGRIDLLPAKPGFREYYGRGVYHCPYCDGWEHHDKALVAYGPGEDGFDLALGLLAWSRHVTLCTDGPARLTVAQQNKLRSNGITLVEDPVTALRGDGGLVAGVLLQAGAALPCDAVFFSSECIQKSPFAKNLGCELDETGSVKCDGQAATGVPGLYVAGNVRGGVHLAIVAAAEGAVAAMAINRVLHEESLQ